MAKKKKVGGFKVPTLNELTRQYGASLALQANELEDTILWIPSTFLALNDLTGGGIPYGRVVEVFGAESSGKSLVAYDFARNAQKMGGHVIWVDAEQAWQNDWAITNGLNLEQVTVINETRIETISDLLTKLALYYRDRLVNNEPILIVVDSIAALDTSDAIDAQAEGGKAEMGSRAKAIYNFLRRRNELFYKLGIAQIYINQVRISLNTGFGQDPMTTPGGKAIAFYASIRLGFFGGKFVTAKIKGKERKVGKLVTIQVKKNKVAPPKATISKAPLYFLARYHEVGFDKYYWLDDILVEADVVEKSSSGTYSYQGQTLCRGEEKFKKLLEEDSTLRKKLVGEAGINTLKASKAQLKEFSGTNLYPLDNTINTMIEDDCEEIEDY